MKEVNSAKQVEQKVKAILLDAHQRKRANKEIDALLKMFHGRKTIRELLPAMKQRGYPRYIIEVAMERAERRIENDDVLGKMELAVFRASLAEE